MIEICYHNIFIDKQHCSVKIFIIILKILGRNGSKKHNLKVSGTPPNQQNNATDKVADQING